MGTTAQKLEYLGTTKSQLKDMINNGLPSEQQITSSTTFRNYVSSIFNAFLEALRTPDTLFTNLPKKSGTGANITLNDTANAPMRIMLNATDITQDGTPTPDSPQDIHTISGDNKVVVNGKNIFDKNMTTTPGYISDTGVNGGSAGTYHTTDFIPIVPNTSYVYSGATNIGGNHSRCYYDINKNFISGIKHNSQNPFINTSPANAYYMKESIDIANIGNLQIEVGNTATTYEPYTSQEADINLKSKNLLNYGKIESTALNVGIVADTNGEVYDATPTGDSRGWNYASSNWYVNLEAGTYTISLDIKTQTTNANASINVYKSDGVITGTPLANKSNVSLNFTLTEATNIGIMAKLYDAVFKIMLNKGSTAEEWKPYYEPLEYCKIGNYEDKFIRNSGKNLFDINATRTNNNTTNSVNGNVLTVTATSSWASMDYLNILLPNNTYTLSFDWKSSTTLTGTDARIYVYNNPTATGSIGAISPTGTSGHLTLTFTNTNNAISLRFSPNNSATVKTTSIDFSNIQINQGNTEVSYEPYGSNEWYIKKNIGKVVLDGTETNWAMYGESGKRKWYLWQAYFINKNIPKPFTNYIDKSNRFKVSQYISGAWTNNMFGWHTSANALLFDTDFGESLSDWTTWLASNNVIVYYAYRTPTYTKITETLAEQLEYVYQLLKSYKGVTNISQVNNDLAFELDVEAVEELI